jgi:hypothetical protein
MGSLLFHGGMGSLVEDPADKPISLRRARTAVLFGAYVGSWTDADPRAKLLRLQRVLGLGSYETAWTWLHKLRRAMVRPDRDRLKGWVEVDETMVGGWEEGVAGRQTESKALVAIAAEADGPGMGRIRMRVMENASAASLHPFVQG